MNVTIKIDDRTLQVEQGMDEDDVARRMMQEPPIYLFIADMNDFMTMVYKRDQGAGDVSGFLENIMEKVLLISKLIIKMVLYLKMI